MRNHSRKLVRLHDLQLHASARIVLLLGLRVRQEPPSQVEIAMRGNAQFPPSYKAGKSASFPWQGPRNDSAHESAFGLT